TVSRLDSAAVQADRARVGKGLGTPDVPTGRHREVDRHDDLTINQLRPTAPAGGQPSPSAGVQIDSDDIGGVVTGKNGPEAGVWVVAETGDLGTRFAKIVVTDDQGRYVIPDLPQAGYNLWVRGYGL